MTREYCSQAGGLPHSDELLSRHAFKTAVFLRSKGLCCFCAKPADAAHHVLDRKLYPDQGYYLSNGAAVCEGHHWECETTRISVEEVRAACGITSPRLPPGVNPEDNVDKWGNRILLDGLRVGGPLYEDSGARKAMAAGGVLGLLLPPNFDSGTRGG